LWILTCDIRRVFQIPKGVIRIRKSKMDRPNKKGKPQIIRKFGKLEIDRAISINIAKFILSLTSVPVHDRINFRFVDITFSAHDAFQE